MADNEDPLAPIEGVTLEAYTEAAVAIHAAPPEEREARAVEHGIPPGRIDAIGEAWDRRMKEHPEIVRRYSDLYQQAMRDAGIQAPEITLEQYAEIIHRGGTEPLEKVLPEFGLTVQTFAMVSQRWIDRMQADPSVAIRFAQIMGPPSMPPPTQGPVQPLL